MKETIDQDYDKEALEAFIAGMMASEPTKSDELQEQLANAAHARDLLEKIKPMLMMAVTMVEEGSEADTPLAVLLAHEDIISMILSIAVSPVHTEFEKTRLICAITIIGLKEYNVAL